MDKGRGRECAEYKNTVVCQIHKLIEYNDTTTHISKDNVAVRAGSPVDFRSANDEEDLDADREIVSAIGQG